MTAPSALVDVEREGAALVVTMNRPERRNAVDRGLADALSAALDMLDDDESLWCGVLTGGQSYFSAGSDLTAGGDYVTERGGEYGIIRRRRRKPLIAAVEGFALGGGMEIVLACDLVVASRTARFGLPEVGIGVIPTCAGLFRAPRSLPLNVARELILTGDMFPARRAYEHGLVNRVVPRELLQQNIPIECCRIAFHIGALNTSFAPAEHKKRIQKRCQLSCAPVKSPFPSFNYIHSILVMVWHMSQEVVAKSRQVAGHRRNSAGHAL